MRRNDSILTIYRKIGSERVIVIVLLRSFLFSLSVSVTRLVNIYCNAGSLQHACMQILNWMLLTFTTTIVSDLTYGPLFPRWGRFRRVKSRYNISFEFYLAPRLSDLQRLVCNCAAPVLFMQFF